MEWSSEIALKLRNFAVQARLSFLKVEFMFGEFFGDLRIFRRIIDDRYIKRNSKLKFATASRTNFFCRFIDNVRLGVSVPISFADNGVELCGKIFTWATGTA